MIQIWEWCISGVPRKNTPPLALPGCLTRGGIFARPQTGPSFWRISELFCPSRGPSMPNISRAFGAIPYCIFSKPFKIFFAPTARNECKKDDIVMRRRREILHFQDRISVQKNIKIEAQNIENFSRAEDALSIRKSQTALRRRQENFGRSGPDLSGFTFKNDSDSAQISFISGRRRRAEPKISQIWDLEDLRSLDKGRYFCQGGILLRGTRLI